MLNSLSLNIAGVESGLELFLLAPSASLLFSVTLRGTVDEF